MATAAQIEANRRNAQKSTGPKTERGKARAKLNRAIRPRGAGLQPGIRAAPPLPVRPAPRADANAGNPSKNAEFGMRNGEWGRQKRRMANVRWRMTEGRWRMPDAGWRMTDGGWRMADDRWRMADDR